MTAPDRTRFARRRGFIFAGGYLLSAHTILPVLAVSYGIIGGVRAISGWEKVQRKANQIQKQR